MVGYIRMWRFAEPCPPARSSLPLRPTTRVNVHGRTTCNSGLATYSARRSGSEGVVVALRGCVFVSPSHQARPNDFPQALQL